MNFFSLCFFALLITKALSTPMYFVGKFNGATQWAYPLGLCTEIGLTGSQWVSCDATNTIAMVKYYSDSKCATFVVQTNYTSASKTSTGLYGFNCVGTNDYLKTSISVGSCTSPSFSLVAYGVVNTCFGLQSVVLNNVTHLNGTAYQKAQCNATHGTVDLSVSAYPVFDTSSGCSANAYTVKQSVSYVYPTCTYYYTAFGFTIYAQVSDCVYNGVSQLPKYYNNSAAVAGHNSVKANYTFSAVVAPTATAISNDDNVNLCGYDWASFFTSKFTGCYVDLVTQCTTDQSDFDDTGLSTISIWANVVCYDGSSLTLSDCSTFGVNTSINAIDTTNLYVDSYTCTSVLKSFGNMQSINFVVLALCFVMSLYIF